MHHRCSNRPGPRLLGGPAPSAPDGACGAAGDAVEPRGTRGAPKRPDKYTICRGASGPSCPHGRRRAQPRYRQRAGGRPKPGHKFELGGTQLKRLPRCGAAAGPLTVPRLGAATAMGTWSPKRPVRNPCEVHGNDGTTQHTLLKAAGLHRARAHLGRAARRLLSYALLTPRAVAARPASSLRLGEFRLSCHEHLQQTLAVPACTAKKRPFPVWPPASLPASPPVYIQVPIQAPKQVPKQARGRLLLLFFGWSSPPTTTSRVVP